MKPIKFTEYLSTLLKLKRNFTADLADTADVPEDQAYFAGKVAAFTELIQAVDAVEGDLRALESEPTEEWFSKDLINHNSVATH